MEITINDEKNMAVRCLPLYAKFKRNAPNMRWMPQLKHHPILQKPCKNTRPMFKSQNERNKNSRNTQKSKTEIHIYKV